MVSDSEEYKQSKAMHAQSASGSTLAWESWDT